MLVYRALTDVIFGSKLERNGLGAFWECTFLERIIFPWKDGMITDDTIGHSETTVRVWGT